MNGSHADGTDAPPPWPVLPPTRGWPLHDTAAARRLEVAAGAALPSHALMARAGLSTARLARAVAPNARRLVAVAGPGNNGGDAVVAATHWHRQGAVARVVLCADAARLPADAGWALEEARQAGVPVADANELLLDHDAVVVDGLLGLGATRVPTGALALAIAAINRSPATVLAVDVPSGLHPERGTSFGGHAVRAHHTLTLLTLKAGLFTADGRDHAGRVWFDPLGVDGAGEPACARLSGPDDAETDGAAAPHASHKGRFGDVVVVGGAPGMGGALQLAARAALAAGAGRVYATPLDPAAPLADTAWPELMHRRWPAWSAPSALEARTVVAGCGGGEAIGELLPHLIARAARLVLDADALNALADDPTLQRAVAARAARGRATVLTPHPLEAARLLGRSAAAVQANRIEALRDLVAALQSTVVLKGSGTLIGAPDRTPRLNPTGNARLASAGTGDVLAGWLGGLWSRRAGGQAARGDAVATATAVAIAATFAHGRAAEETGGRGPLNASALIDALRGSG